MFTGNTHCMPFLFPLLPISFLPVSEFCCKSNFISGIGIFAELYALLLKFLSLIFEFDMFKGLLQLFVRVFGIMLLIIFLLSYL